MCADTSTGNTPQFIWPICTNWLIIWNIFLKKLSSHVHENMRVASEILLYFELSKQGKLTD